MIAPATPVAIAAASEIRPLWASTPPSTRASSPGSTRPRNAGASSAVNANTRASAGTPWSVRMPSTSPLTTAPTSMPHVRLPRPPPSFPDRGRVAHPGRPCWFPQRIGGKWRDIPDGEMSPRVVLWRCARDRLERWHGVLPPARTGPAPAGPRHRRRLRRPGEPVRDLTLRRAAAVRARAADPAGQPDYRLSDPVDPDAFGI